MQDINTKHPCYNCEKRHEYCHADCEPYVEYNKKLRERENKIRESKREINEFSGYVKGKEWK